MRSSTAPGRITGSKARSMQLAVAMATAGLQACSGDTNAAAGTDQGADSTSTNGGSAGVGGQGAPSTSSTGTMGGAGGVTTMGGAGGVTTMGGAGGAAGAGGAGGTAAGAAGNPTTGAGGAPPDGDPDAMCMAFCASSAVTCLGPDLEVASASSITSTTPTGCTISAMLPFSGSVEVTLDCSSLQICVGQGSGCVGSSGECYPVQVGDSGFSYLVPACIHGSLGCSPD